MKNIVLLTDFSETARHACNYALDMFSRSRVDFYLLNAYDFDFAGSPYISRIKEEMTEESLKRLNNEVSILRSRYPDARLEALSRYGPLVDVIMKVCGELDPYLIVLGCRGENVIENFLLGSNAYEVVKNIHYPVMAVPQHSNFVDINKIVFATDFKIIDQVLASPIYDICREFGSELCVVNVVDNEITNHREHEQRLAALFTGVQVSFHFLDGKDVCKSISTFAEQTNASLIIMVRHNYGFFERLIHSSVTRQMVLHPRFPMLILHPA